MKSGPFSEWDEMPLAKNKQRLSYSVKPSIIMSERYAPARLELGVQLLTADHRNVATAAAAAFPVHHFARRDDEDGGRKRKSKDRFKVRTSGVIDSFTKGAKKQVSKTYEANHDVVRLRNSSRNAQSIPKQSLLWVSYYAPGILKGRHISRSEKCPPICHQFAAKR